MNSLSLIRNFSLIFGLVILLLPVTALGDNTDSTIRFVIIGDRTGGHVEGVYPRVIEQAARLNPEFFITVGDMIEGYTSDSVQLATEWTEIKQFFAPITVPVYFTPGNHDITFENMLPAYNEYIGEPYYSVDFKSIHITIIDNSRFDWPNSLPSEQLEWLADELKNSQDASVRMVFMHQPVWYNTVVAGKPDTLHSLFKTYNVDAVFCGHFHSYFSGEYDGIKYTNIGSSGGGLPDRPGGLGYHFAYVTVNGSDISVVPIKADAVLPWDVTSAKDIERGTLFYNKGIESITGAMVGTDLKVTGSEAKIRITNYSESLSLDDTLRWSIPEGWSIEPSVLPITMQPGETKEVSFMISSGETLYPVPEVSVSFPYSEAGPYKVTRALDITRTATCVKQTPTIDGVISSGEWSEPVTEFFAANGEKTACDPVEFYFSYDKENLYLAAKCTETMLDSLVANVAERDGGIYTEDCVGYFLQPDINEAKLYQIYINPLGTIFDQVIWQKEDGYYISDKSWDGDYQIATGKGDGFWSVEAQIPLEQLGIEATSGDKWRMNFRRKQKRLGKTANWQAPIDYNPETFGFLIFK